MKTVAMKKTIFRNPITQATFRVATALTIMVGLIAPMEVLAAGPGVLSGDIRLTVVAQELDKMLPLTDTSQIVNMSFHGVPTADALRALAKKGGFNIAIDESVKGTLNIDLKNVSLQDALASIKSYSNLAYGVNGNTLMVADAESDRGKSFERAATTIIPLRHANAKTVANLLNTALFGAQQGMGGTSGTASGQQLKVTPDYHTNSLVVVGTPSDIKTVQDHVQVLDAPRETRTWRLSHANALDVAAILSSSLFNEGQAGLMLEGGGSGNSAASGQGGNRNNMFPSTMRVRAENIQESEGATTASQGNSDSEGVVSEMTLRTRKKEDQTIQISPEGPLIIPDTRLNTITLMATAEQIAMAEALIPTLDRKAPQVVLEASLIEVSSGARKDFGFSTAARDGKWALGSNNTQDGTSDLFNNPFTNAIGLPTSVTNPYETVFQLGTNPISKVTDFVYQLNALVSQNKAKVLANPTVVTTHDNETIISIVDEIIRSVTVTANSAGNDVGVEATIGEVGIVLNILPKVGADGTISLRVRPTVSTVSDTYTDRFQNTITLVSKREVLAQNVTLKDGESFILGGLIQDTDSDTVNQLPFLADLPIVSALGRSSIKNKNKTELLIVITPHIMDQQTANERQPSPFVPAIQHSRHNGADSTVPVSHSPIIASPSALPPLERANIIGGTPQESRMMDSGPASKQWTKPSTQPAAQPLGEVKTPQHVAETKQTSRSTFKPQAHQVGMTPQSDKPVVHDPLDTSDEAIRTIMEKFKPQ